MVWIGLAPLLTLTLTSAEKSLNHWIVVFRSIPIVMERRLLRLHSVRSMEREHRSLSSSGWRWKWGQTSASLMVYPAHDSKSAPHPPACPPALSERKSFDLFV